MQRLTVFAYGTLITGARSSAIQTLLDECLVRRQPGWVRGRLYDLGPYPGLVAAPRRSEQVHGEILELCAPKRCLAALDDYEDYDPRRPEASTYRRAWCRASLADGGAIWAWVYWYQGPAQRARRIPNGDWRDWLGRVASP
jgi:gamma-glutamylcyclotransferase (GGCT)/AIG2-like uncharacterized protein YtfP